MPQHSDGSANAISMPRGFSALLVYDQDEPVCGVARIFLSNGIRLRRSRNCFEARSVLSELSVPNVVVTDLALPDGDWSDILRATNASPARTAVIVVSRLLDTRLYLDVLESGAHDFVVPPVSPSELACIIRAAIRNDRPFTPYCRAQSGPGGSLSRYSAVQASSVRIIDPLPRNKERIR